MKILALSDSHSALYFMRRCIETVKPDAVIHLGDYFEDGKAMEEEYSHIPFHLVPGNCDSYRVAPWQAQILCYPVCGVPVYMTHGHRHGVKMTLTQLLADARASRADIVLYGHTHVADCHREADGLWVMNPGSCGYGGGSAGIVEVDKGKIVSCRIIRQEDLEEMK